MKNESMWKIKKIAGSVFVFSLMFLIVISLNKVTLNRTSFVYIRDSKMPGKKFACCHRRIWRRYEGTAAE